MFLTKLFPSWLWETPTIRLDTLPTNTQSSQWQHHIPLKRKNYGKYFFPINTSGSLVLCFAAVLQSFRQRNCWKISYITHFICDRVAKSSLINISTESENGQGLLKLHYVTLSPNENPIKLDNFPHPILDVHLCTSVSIFFPSKATSHKAILPPSLLYWSTHF